MICKKHKEEGKMLYEFMFLIPEIFVCEIGAVYAILQIDFNSEKGKKYDVGFFVKKEDLKNMTKEEKKSLCRTVTLYTLMAILMTAAVGLLFSFLIPNTALTVLGCIIMQIALSVYVLIRLKNKVVKKSP